MNNDTPIPLTARDLCEDCLADCEEVRASYLLAGVKVCDSHLDIRLEG